MPKTYFSHNNPSFELSKKKQKSTLTKVQITFSFFAFLLFLVYFFSQKYFQQLQEKISYSQIMETKTHFFLSHESILSLKYAK